MSNDDALFHRQSSSAAKIGLFPSLFRGREDVYPRRFESRKTGTSRAQFPPMPTARTGRAVRRKHFSTGVWRRCPGQNGYLVLRFLAEDVGKELDSVLDTMSRAVSARRASASMTAPLNFVRPVRT
jgi:hypothetical protein